MDGLGTNERLLHAFLLSCITAALCGNTVETKLMAAGKLILEMLSIVHVCVSVHILYSVHCSHTSANFQS